MKHLGASNPAIAAVVNIITPDDWDQHHGDHGWRSRLGYSWLDYDAGKPGVDIRGDYSTIVEVISDLAEIHGEVFAVEDAGYFSLDMQGNKLPWHSIGRQIDDVQLVARINAMWCGGNQYRVYKGLMPLLAAPNPVTPLNQQLQDEAAYEDHVAAVYKMMDAGENRE